MNILIVEGNISVAKYIKKTIKKIESVHIVDVAQTFQEGFNKALSDVFDLVLIDASLQDTFNGFDLCVSIRKGNKKIPIIMLSAFQSAKYLEVAFENGVNDFITKPFQSRELELRIRSWANLHEQGRFKNKIVYEGIFYDSEQKEFFYQKKHIFLTKKDKALLFLFLKNQEEVISEQYIRAKLWGDDITSSNSRNIRSNINLLRRALPHDCCSWIRTIKGKGYLLQKEGLYQSNRF